MRRTHLSRREFLARASLAAFALSGARLFSQDAGVGEPKYVTVQSPCGGLRGVQAEGVRIFRGVPFTKPPVGALRFKPPMNMEPWTETRDATRFASAPMQPGGNHLAQSEDCLYLNVWAPQEQGTYPVLVWVHGGGFTGGDFFSSDQDGTKFASEGIVCITVEYRLGVFGFLDLEPLLGEAYTGSANNALLDLIAALQWVQDNVAAFGGDPARVTLGGQSAGAKLTDTLMGIQAAEPLFQQMISESGGAERVWSPVEARVVAEAFGRTWAEVTSAISTGLADAPASSLIAAQQNFIKHWPRNFPLRPEIDRAVLPQMPIASIHSGSARGKRPLLGANLGEGASFLGTHPQQNPVAAELGNMSVQPFERVLERYRNVYPRMNLDERRIRAVSAEEYWIPSVRVADAQV